MKQVSLNQARQEDRKELETLLTALNGAKRALRRDECGDWTINGSRGIIQACEGEYSVFLSCRSIRAWNSAKKRLASFTAVRQDGDEEGILVLSRMPDKNEAETLRSYIGLRQTHAAPTNSFQPRQIDSSSPYMR
jgi:hypothetical protein